MEIIQIIVDFIVTNVERFGYWGIAIMMFLQSSFFPFPSEIVMPPAGYLAATGKMNLYAALGFGIVGSLAGALFNYFLAFFLGRKFILKFGKYFFITEEGFKKTENFIQKHGEIGTFVGWLIPLFRQYISFPAGLARMNAVKFSFYTLCGSGLWIIILTMIGYFVGHNKELVQSYSRNAALLLLGFGIIIVLIYIKIRRKKCSKEQLS
ncbi:MAG: DedA family protein [Candidatus Muiribacteriota bacterium]